MPEFPGEEIIGPPGHEVVEVYEEMEFIGDYQASRNYCVGVINISKLESIQYHREGNEYHITVSYIGSSQDADGTLTIQATSGNPLRDSYPTDQAMEHAIQKLISGISTAMQTAYLSSRSNVVEYYPMFDLGNTTLRSTFSPYEKDNAVDPNEELLKEVQALLAGAVMG
tara:strand:+ start:221 stop:727 length:507 start_codon:yes stop_codon:yes gene_type:complete